MRVLQLSARNIWPLNTGAKLREFHLARQVANHFPLTYAGLWDENEHPHSEVCPAQALLPSSAEIVMVPKERRYTFSKLVRGLFGTPISILNCTTHVMSETLAVLLRERRFDAVQIEGVHLAGYLKLIRGVPDRPRIVCDWHNIESELMRRYASRAPGAARRIYARRTAASLARFERLLLEVVDAHVVPSERERQRLLELAPAADIRVVDNGVDAAWFQDCATPPRSARRRVLFVGSMDYHANIEGALWFANDVWPLLRERVPGIVLTIVGRQPAAEIQALASLPGIEVTGTVDDVRPFYREAIVSVVPLRTAGGTRLKIPEAMAAGVPVVSTKLGAEGLVVTPGADLLIGDSEEELAAAVAALARDEERWRAIAAAGLRLARQRYDWSRAAQPLIDIYQGFAAHTRTAATE
jgi:sugar transferase (PEP-CTERM/EpsH1 system associated)